MTPLQQDGEPAQLVTFHSSLQGAPTFAAEAIIVHGEKGFFALWISPAGQESADWTTFVEFLSTFSFTV